MITIWAKEVTKDNINIYYCFAPRMNTFLRKTIIPGLKESDFKNPEDVSKKIIDNWSNSSTKFIKVMPTDYKKALELMSQSKTEKSF